VNKDSILMKCSNYQLLIEHKRESAFDDTVLGWCPCQDIVKIINDLNYLDI